MARPGATDAEVENAARAALADEFITDVPRGYDTVAGERGVQTLVIAHRLSTIRSAARILVLEEGRVVEQGGHDDLLAHGRVHRSLIAPQTEAARRASPE